MEVCKISFVLLVCFSNTTMSRPNLQDRDENDVAKLLNRVPRKSVFIAPKIFTTEEFRKCPNGFARSMGNLCVEVIQPSPKAFDSVLLERLQAIEYDYDYEEGLEEDILVVVDVKDESSRAEDQPSSTETEVSSELPNSSTASTETQTPSTTRSASTEVTSTSTGDSIKVEEIHLSDSKNDIASRIV